MPKKPISKSKELALFYQRLASYMGSAPLKEIMAMANMAPHHSEEDDEDEEDDRLDITDPEKRAALPSTGTSHYFDVECIPPKELRAFLEGEDGGKMKEERFLQIEASVVDWMNKQYPLPSWLGYYLESSPILKEEGVPAPLELWITHRENCYAYSR